MARKDSPLAITGTTKQYLPLSRMRMKISDNDDDDAGGENSDKTCVAGEN